MGVYIQGYLRKPTISHTSGGITIPDKQDLSDFLRAAARVCEPARANECIFACGDVDDREPSDDRLRLREDAVSDGAVDPSSKEIRYRGIPRSFPHQ